MLEVIPISKSLWRNKIAAALIIAQLTLTIAIISNALFIIYQRHVEISRPTGIAVNELIKMISLKVSPDVNMEVIVKSDMEFIRGLPDVIDATVLSGGTPLSGGGRRDSFKTTIENGYPSYSGNVFSITEHGVNTLGMKIIEGRNFTAEDVSYNHEGSNYFAKGNTAMVTASLAELLFPNESAVGKTIYENGMMPRLIIGVIEQMMGSWPGMPEGRGAGQVIFFPVIDMSGTIVYEIRTAKEKRGAVMLAIVEGLRARENNRLISFEETMEEVLRNSYSDGYAMIKILTTIASLLVLVNALGIVGLSTFLVNQRRKQIGIRRALGATKTAIVRYFLVENALLCLCAGILGGALALFTSDFMVREFSLDLLPWQFVVGTIIVILILTMLATASPALRASRISPAEATA